MNKSTALFRSTSALQLAGRSPNVKTRTHGNVPAPDRWRCYRARHWVFKLLQPMQLGHMVFELPDGHCIEFGAAPGENTPPLAGGIVPSARIIVRRERFFRRCLVGGDIGFGEAYMDGDWDTPDVTAVVAWFLLNLENAPGLSGSRRRAIAASLFRFLRLTTRAAHLLRPDPRRLARRNIAAHYDLSNHFFSLMLDPAMNYSSARWSHPAQSLAEAQTEKCETLCRALQLSPYDHVLEIGTGWGGWAIHAAQTYGCRISTITISEQQFTLAWERVRHAGVSDRVDVQLCDFRDVVGRYDKVVSIEMMEALGHENLPEFCRVIERILKPRGLAALQFITCPDARYNELRRGTDFIQKHIFPGSLLLSLNRVSELLSRSGGFVLRQLDDFGHDYARTLRHWRENFQGNLESARALGFDESFVRKWRYYLSYCEAAFALRNISVVQTLYTRPNNPRA